eukprot:7384469-Prymnesium_polylepis.3
MAQGRGRGRFWLDRLERSPNSPWALRPGPPSQPSPTATQAVGVEEAFESTSSSASTAAAALPPP